jgi:hypothetical protein
MRSWLLITGLLVACEQGGPAHGASQAHTSGASTGSTLPAEGDGADLGDSASGGAASVSAQDAGARATGPASGSRPADDVRGSNGTSGTSGTSAPADDAPAPSGDGGPAVDDSAELFDQDALPRFDITLSATSVAMLRADGESYVPGDLRYGDETVSNVGVRIKGSATRRTLDEKPAFKLKLDEYVADQSFRGLRRLTLNNLVEDPSFIAERLAYAVYRAAGLPAPRCNNALVYVNGELYGVYANVESEDKTFLRRWFADEDGNLYEAAGVDLVPGAEQSFELETNETKNDRSDLRALITALTNASVETFLTDLGPVLDLPRFLRFTAAEAAVNQWDMYAYTVFYPNNFRLYRDPTTQKFVFLPWGMDLSMKPYLDTGRAQIPILELAHDHDQHDAPVTAGLLFQRCLASGACRVQYRDAVREIVGVYEGLNLEALAQRYHDQIAQHVLEDPRTPYNAEQFEAGYQKVLTIIRERPSTIRAELEP